jgi:hypothetical protein
MRESTQPHQVLTGGGLLPRGDWEERISAEPVDGIGRGMPKPVSICIR